MPIINIINIKSVITTARPPNYHRTSS